jgi:GDP-L-fucose synthase
MVRKRILSTLDRDRILGMDQEKILITGASGLVGANLVHYLRDAGFRNIVASGKKDCDLLDRSAVLTYFKEMRPTYVFHLAAFVNGIMGNINNQAEAYLLNTLINTHVIEACHTADVKKVVAMGSVAMYPNPLPCNPLREEVLLQGIPHGSEYGYAMAKRGLLAQLDTYSENYGMQFALVLSTNLFGPHDRFNTETGHVIPSIVKKFYDAKINGTEVVIWGDGSAQRDFLYVKDATRGLLMIMDNVTGTINLASGITRRIEEAVDILAKYTDLEECVVWDSYKPNGQIYRAYDISKLNKIGFQTLYPFKEALEETYDWYALNAANARHQ